MEKSNDRSEVVSLGLKYLFFSFIPVLIFTIVCYFSDFIYIPRIYFLFLLFYYLFLDAYQFLQQLAKGMEHIFDMGIAGILSTVILLVGNILLLLYFDMGLNGFFIANILSLVVPSLYLSFKLKVFRYIRFHNENKELQRAMLLYCVPLMFSVLGWWVNSTSDKYIVAFMCGAAANGLLSVSYKIPSILNTFQSIFIQAWQITAIKEYGSKDSAQFYGKSFSNFSIVICLACSGLILLTRPIAEILFSSDFYVAWQYVPFLLISCVFNATAGFLGPILSATKDSKNMARSAIYGASSNIIMNFLMIYILGIQGATIATVIASFIIFIVRKVALHDTIIIEQYWKIKFTWVLLIVQALIEIYLSGLFYLEILVISGILVLNYSNIKNLLHSVKTLVLKK